MTPSPMLTVAAVADLLAVSKMTVHRLIAAGELNAYRIGHGIRIDQRDLTAYLRGAATKEAGE